MATSQTSRYRDNMLSREHVECLVAQGRKIVIFDGRVLKVDAWIPYHPGGDKAILHMVGRDGTNEIKAFHSFETQQIMLRYQIGRVEGIWKDFTPPIQGGVFRQELDVKDMNTDIAQEQCNKADTGAFDDQSQGSSNEPSPIFEPVEHHSKGLRLRKGSCSALSEASSATSLSSLTLPEPTDASKSLSSPEQRTQQELERDLRLYPSLDVATQTEIIRKYNVLNKRIRDNGLYDCNYWAYFVEATRYLALALTAFYLLRIGWYKLSAVFLGMLWHQLVFTVHDAGHMGITHDFHVDSCIGIGIAGFLGGLSCCWWKRNHNVHHIVTNSAEHDPDIQHMPFFAISHRFFSSLRSTYYDRVMTYDSVAKFTLRYQHWLYYPILTLGRFNLYVLSWQYIFLGQGPRKGPAWWHRYLEVAGQFFFWYWFGYLTLYKSVPSNSQRVLYLLISHAVTMPVHVQITLSHFAMSTTDLGVAESFPQRMLRTTMDVDCPAWFDFFHGGLQFQAVHHLFPRIPRHNLRKAQVYVREFCMDVGIPYTIHGFKEGNEQVIGQLGEIAKQARMMGECSRSMGPADVFDGH
ncbi:fatty acid/sphingolipid desaturase [Polychaeton citri CBS 116435]|uniref:Delta 8-(E)-sphingolipid desaturase n=1 Tax=Polychaeton citri CBS 116435 TaxID=1314669 RepID=A0A9P4USV1_9PEZI|nr:fatty acid/sphingolipid desaturase [Polychaeton citri CBS 116435]